MSIFSKIKEFIKQIEIEKVEFVDELKNLDDCRKKAFTIVGVSHYQKNFKKVLKRNTRYDNPTKEEIEYYEYEYNRVETFDNVLLVEEPTNEYDPNAIYVKYKSKKLGYIKKDATEQVRKLLNKKHKIKITIYGGNRKLIYPNGKYKIEDNRTLGCEIEIYTKK